MSVFDIQIPVLETPYRELDVRPKVRIFLVLCGAELEYCIFEDKEVCKPVACSERARYQYVHFCSAVNGL
jgi:hypothetical protein